MKIAFCIGQLTKGGAERVVCNLANCFSKTDDITIISLRNDKPAYEIDKKINVIFLDREKKNKITKNLIRRKELKKILRKNNFDAIICFLPEPSFLVLSLKKLITSKIIVSVRNDPKIEYSSFIYNFLMKKLYTKADGFVFQTRDAQKYFVNEIQKKSKIILNSINPSFLINNKAEKRDNKIVSVGRLEEQKNQKNLILAFSNISKKYQNYKLIIYGEGSLRKELEDLISEKKLNDRVYLPGISDNIKDEIKNASIFVLPSNYEGLPNSLMEAMVLGVPCISTDCPCGGPKTLIQSGVNGILIPVNNVQALEKSIEDLLENDKLTKKISKESAKIAKILDPKVINKEWYDYIKKVTKE